MTNGDLIETAKRLEDSIQRLPGIRGVKVEAEAGTIAAVRLLVLPERDTESTIAQVRSIASTDHGVDLDPGIIQVLRTTRADASAARRAQRRRLGSITTERAHNTFRARVTLELPGDVLVGESATAVGEAFEQRSVATAVLQGLDVLLDFPVGIDSIEVFGRGSRAVVLVTLYRESERLVGTALIKRDEHDAIARATLDALNRFLLPQDQPA